MVPAVTPSHIETENRTALLLPESVSLGRRAVLFFHLLLVTTSKALAPSSDALAPSSGVVFCAPQVASFAKPARMYGYGFSYARRLSVKVPV